MRNSALITATSGCESQQNAEASVESLDGGIIEGPDDPGLRLFINKREKQRQQSRAARPAPWESDPASPKQLAYLRFLGYRRQVQTKGEAALLIGKLAGPK